MKSFRVMGCNALVALLSSMLAVSAWADEAPQTAAAAVGAAKSPPTTCHCSGDLSPSVERIKRVLSEPLKSSGLEFSDEPLASIANFLQDEYGIPIQLDVPALEDAGMTQDEPLTVNLRSISLRSALRLMLKTKQLTYIIRDEVLIITTPEEAETELIACVYDVRDLIGGNRASREIKALADAIVSCVAPNTWAVHKGGEAEIGTLPPGLLIISQTQAVHEEIADLLALIRATLRQPIQRPEGEAMGMMGGRGGYGLGGRGMEGGGRGEFGGEFGYGGTSRGYGESYGGRGNEHEPAPTPAGANPFD